MKIACFINQDQEVNHIAQVDELQLVATSRLACVGRLKRLFGHALSQESA